MMPPVKSWPWRIFRMRKKPAGLISMWTSQLSTNRPTVPAQWAARSSLSLPKTRSLRRSQSQTRFPRRPRKKPIQPTLMVQLRFRLIRTGDLILSFNWWGRNSSKLQSFSARPCPIEFWRLSTVLLCCVSNPLKDTFWTLTKAVGSSSRIFWRRTSGQAIRLVCEHQKVGSTQFLQNFSKAMIHSWLSLAATVRSGSGWLLRRNLPVNTQTKGIGLLL